MTALFKHIKAMDMAERALVCKARGRPYTARFFYCIAYTLEAEVASISENLNMSWSAGVYYRSAAWLAFNSGNMAKAKSLALKGLKVEGIPRWTRAELNEVLEALEVENEIDGRQRLG